MLNRLLLATILSLASLADAQVVQTTAGADCGQFSGSDAGIQVSACISAAGVGQYNARPIIGTQVINGTSLIPSSNPTGELLLGNTTYWLTSSATSIAIPSHFHVIGIGDATQQVDSDTIFRACSASDIGAPCNGLAFPSNTPIFCFGHNGVCGGEANGNDGQGFDAWISRVRIDCNGVSGCIGLQNKSFQENSGIFDSSIVNWGGCASGPPCGIGLLITGEVVPAWVAHTNYGTGYRVIPSPGNSHYYQNTAAACTSGGPAQPTFPTNGGSVNDNGCVWQDEGTEPAWQMSHNYLANALITPTVSNGHYYINTAGACTSGTMQPSPWNTTGGPNTGNPDGTCDWTDQGTSPPTIPKIAPGNSSYGRLIIQNIMSFACGAGAVGIFVNDPTSSGSPKSIETVTINNPGCTSTNPTDDMRISTGGRVNPVSLRDIHVETATNGITVGGDSAAVGVTIDGVGSVTTNQVNISNAFSSGTGTIWVRNVTACTPPGTCNLINDQINGNTISFSAEAGAIGSYYLGNPGSGTLITTAVSVPSTYGNLNVFPESVDLKSGAQISEIPNSATGTTLNKLAKLTTTLGASTAVTTTTTDSSGILGVVVGQAGVSGNAQISVSGIAPCVFDGGTTANDYVQNSPTTGGDCHDAGASRPTVGQVMGRVLSTNSSGGTYAMLVTGPDDAAPGITSLTMNAPLTGGTITTAGSIGCPTCVTSASSLTNRGVVIGGGGQASSTIDFPDVKYIPSANCKSSTGGNFWSLGSGGAATCRAGTNNLGGYVSITTLINATFQVAIPEDWDSGSNPYIRFQLASTDTTSGHTIIPEINIACYKGDGSTTDDVAPNGVHALSTITLNGNANRFWSSSNTQMNSTDMTGCVPGALMQVTVGRSTDTATNANFYGATITFPRLLAVQAN
jgi:hypothetical protein